MKNIRHDHRQHLRYAHWLLAVILTLLPAPVESTLCKAKEKALQLTEDTSGGVSVFSVTSNRQLRGALKECTTIDYLRVRNCHDCTQQDWCALQLTGITGKDPVLNYSVSLFNTSGFFDMCGLRSVTNQEDPPDLPGGLNLHAMNGLRSVNGLGGIGKIHWIGHGTAIGIKSCTSLVNAMGLERAYIGWYAEMHISGNVQLKCVPEKWPAADSDGTVIPHGSCIVPTPPTTISPTPPPAPHQWPTPLPSGGGTGNTAKTNTLAVELVSALAGACALIAVGFLFLHTTARSRKWQGEDEKGDEIGAKSRMLQTPLTISEGPGRQPSASGTERRYNQFSLYVGNGDRDPIPGAVVSAQ
jgi:hypothetical protein